MCMYVLLYMPLCVCARASAHVCDDKCVVEKMNQVKRWDLTSYPMDWKGECRQMKVQAGF